MKKFILRLFLLTLFVGGSYFAYYELREDVISKDEQVYVENEDFQESDGSQSSGGGSAPSTPSQPSEGNTPSTPSQPSGGGSQPSDPVTPPSGGGSVTETPTDPTLTSSKIDGAVLHYPDSNTALLNEYSSMYSGASSNYKVYSSYYSSEYDTLYVSYDHKTNPVQTIKSKQLAMIEEHLLNYFEMSLDAEEYKYLKVVRIYPDYASSACRPAGSPVSVYESIQGCASYNSLQGVINLNKLTTIEGFFNDVTVTEGNLKYGIMARRLIFAHEFGHVLTYHDLVLKGDDSYADYLKLRLGEAYSKVYPTGLPDDYSMTNDTYNTQPVEILADDYVELYYDVSAKKSNDYYDYDLNVPKFNRGSLFNISKEGGVQKLKSNQQLFNKMKEYFDKLMYKDYKEVTPFIVNSNGKIYQTISNIASDTSSLTLTNKKLIVLGELTVANEKYYRVILRNFVTNKDTSLKDYGDSIGYIKVSSTTVNTGNEKVLLFQKWGSMTAMTGYAYPAPNTSNVYFMPYYDFSYFIESGTKALAFNYLDNSFTTIELPLNQLK